MRRTAVQGKADSMNKLQRIFALSLAFLLALSVMGDPVISLAEDEAFSYGNYEEGIQVPSYSYNKTVPALKDIDGIMNGDFQEGFKYWIGMNGKLPSESAAIKRENGNAYLSFDGRAESSYDGINSPVFSLKEVPVGTVLGILYKWRGQEGYQIYMEQWAMESAQILSANTRIQMGSEDIYRAESDEDWNISVLYMRDGVTAPDQSDKTLYFSIGIQVMDDPSLRVDIDDVQIIRKTNRSIRALDFTLLYDLDNPQFPIREEKNPDYSAFNFNAEKLPIPGPTGIQTVPRKAENPLVQGFPAPVGDVFELPAWEAVDGAPIISQITPQANPDDAVMLAGEGFASEGLKAYVYAQNTTDNGRPAEAEYTIIDDTKMSLVIDKDLAYGVYAIYLENAQGKGNVKLINTPEIWFLGQEHLAKGENLDIYGENLTRDNQTDTSVFLVADGEYCQLTTTYSDRYKITAIIPDTLTIGKEYAVYVHNGHGGEYGFATAEEKVLCLEKSAVMFEGKIVDVTQYGAKPDDFTNDDTKAVLAAIEAAEPGDTVYFPAGVYFLSETIIVDKPLRFCGDNKESAVIHMANAVKTTLFALKSSCVEFINLGFWHKRSAGMLAASVIFAQNVETDENAYTLKVTHCKFAYSVPPKFRSFKWLIAINNCDGVILENNEFDSSSILSTYSCDRVRFRNNKALASLYTGVYYGQNTTLFTHTNRLDFSNNIIQGKDILEDPTGILDSDNMTAGRSIAVQGAGTNFYICNNTFERTGLPNDNAGEQIMLENLGHVYDGEAVFADAWRLTLPSDTVLEAGYMVNITSGKGQSQCREIKYVNGRTITLADPWDVMPDNTSKILITNCFRDLAISNNYVDGYANYLSNPGASTGIQVYGSTYNLYYTNNTTRNICEGICIQPYYMNDNSKTVISWNMFDGNTIENCGEGIRFIYTTASQNAAEVSYGIVFRRMLVKNIENYTIDREHWRAIGGKGLRLGGGEDAVTRQWKWDSNGINGVVFDRVNFENCELADICLTNLQNHAIFRNCTSDQGDLQVLQEADYGIWKIIDE